MWALNAPKLNLPEGVGFRVGGPDSDIDWLVLQVHYATVDKTPEEGGLLCYYVDKTYDILFNYIVFIR